MHPTFELYDTTLPSYGATLFIGIVAGFLLAVTRGRLDKLTKREVLLPAFFGTAAGLLGSSLWSLVVERAALTGELELDHVFAGSGFSVVGGLLLGAAAAAAATRALRIGFLRWGDVAVPGVAIGVGIGRVGCLLAGCCYGQPTLFPIALVFENFDTAARPIGVPLHATQPYAAAALFLLGVLLWRLPVSPRGLRFGAFLAGYGLLRSVVELLRADYRGWIGGVPATQLAAAVTACVGIAIVIATRRRATTETFGKRVAESASDRAPR